MVIDPLAASSSAGFAAVPVTVTERITEARGRALRTEDYIARRTEIDYATYTRFREKLKMS